METPEPETPETPEISFDRPKLERFKKALRAAPEGEDRFVFEGHVVLKAYAKYMIEYLETLLEPLN